jgi:hypothetical protein
MVIDPIPVESALPPIVMASWTVASEFLPAANERVPDAVQPNPPATNAFIPEAVVDSPAAKDRVPDAVVESPKAAE